MIINRIIKSADEDIAAGYLLLKAMQWEHESIPIGVLRGMDKETGEILIDEHALMRLIMIANPAQRFRKLKLVRD